MGGDKRMRDRFGQLVCETTHYPSGRPSLMGILNVTPDSFSDGGSHADVKAAGDHARRMIDEGADSIDVGGESSRPGALPVSCDEELRRVIPVIEALAGTIDVPLSIDTTKAVVAREACRAGASIINDISALRHDPDMADVAAEADAIVVLMHMQGTPGTMQQNPEYVNVVDDIIRFLDERIDVAEQAGISRDRIIIDPGIGFGKTLEHNLTILHDIRRFHELGCPVLIGASRKGMIGSITGEPVSQRTFGTAAIVAHGVLNGVQMHRVHDVKAIRQVCDMLAAIGQQAWNSN